MKVHRCIKLSELIIKNQHSVQNLNEDSFKVISIQKWKRLLRNIKLNDLKIRRLVY